MTEYYKQYHEKYKEKRREYRKQYYEDNKEKITKQMKQYREGHKKEIAKHNKRYRELHREEAIEYSKQYFKTPQGQVARFNGNNKRRSKQRTHGNGITTTQWLEMMNFFGWKCAYSDIYVGGNENKNIRSIDHIIALDNGGLNEIWNCVPMYKSYNSSKHTSDILEWYQQQDFYSEERLQKIYEWQEYAYNKWNVNI